MPFNPVQVNCKNCGANIVFDPTIRITKCNYCGSQIVLEQSPDSMNEWPKVDGIYSPKVDETKFKEILSNFFCESIDIPDDLLDTHQEQECYLSFCPFYRYDVEFRANWTADIGYY